MNHAKISTRKRKRESMGNLTQDIDEQNQQVKRRYNHIEQEMVLMQVESLLTKSVTSPSRIAQILKIDRATATKYKERIEFRWRNQSTTSEINTSRGLMLAKYELLEATLWDRMAKLIRKIDNDKSNDNPLKAEAIVISICKTLGLYQRHIAELKGLTRHVIETRFNFEGHNSSLTPEEYRRLESIKHIFIEEARNMGLLSDDTSQD